MRDSAYPEPKMDFELKNVQTFFLHIVDINFKEMIRSSFDL